MAGKQQISQKFILGTGNEFLSVLQIRGIQLKTGADRFLGQLRVCYQLQRDHSNDQDSQKDG